MKSISAIHPAIMENTKNIFVKRAPHISIRESHNASMSNLFYNMQARHSMKNATAIFMSHTEAITCLPQIITLRGCEEKNGRSKGYKGSTLMQAL